MKNRENSAVLAAVHVAPHLASNLTRAKIVLCTENIFKIHALMIFLRKIIAK